MKINDKIIKNKVFKLDKFIIDINICEHGYFVCAWSNKLDNEDLLIKRTDMYVKGNNLTVGEVLKKASKVTKDEEFKEVCETIFTNNKIYDKIKKNK